MASPPAGALARPRAAARPGAGWRVEERRLVERHREIGDPAAREELVRRYLPLARRLASRFRYTGEPGDDLDQVAFLALVKAVDRYDPGRGNTFYSYAVPTILGELKHHLRNTWTLHAAGRAGAGQARHPGRPRALGPARPLAPAGRAGRGHRAHPRGGDRGARGGRGVRRPLP